MNPETTIDDDDDNAFIYACENKRVDLLKMMIDAFQISPDQNYDYYYEIGRFTYIIYKCTGFIYACFNNDI